MAGPPDANTIKTQIATLLTPAIGTVGTRRTKIIDTMQFPFGVGKDPTALRSELDPVVLLEGEGVKSRINCLMITEAGMGQSPPPSDSTRLLTEARGYKTITRRFRLTFFYEVDDQGSENRASAVIETSRVTLNQSPKLGFAVQDGMIAGPAMFIDGHDGLQMSDFLPEEFGMAMAHVGYCTLAVRVREPQGQG
jgi:hypothetical protein